MNLHDPCRSSKCRQPTTYLLPWLTLTPSGVTTRGHRAEQIGDPSRPTLVYHSLMTDDRADEQLKANSSDREPAAEAATEKDDSLEKKLEQLATFSLLTVGTLMKVIESHGIEALGPEGHGKLAKARDGVVAAIKGLDDWIESEQGQAAELDLRGLRSKLVDMTQQLDIWQLDQETLPS